MTVPFSPNRALFSFGFRQVLRSAVTIGVLAGFMLTIQGVAYQKTYSTHAAQEKFAKSLAAAPGLGFLYGDPKNLDAGTAGYMTYRVLGFVGLLTAAWALTTTTKLFRGNEEDGRWEVIRSSSVTARSATALPLLGFYTTWCLALVISMLMTIGATASAGIALSSQAAILLNLAIFAPALLFAGIGTCTSQLGLTRGRALLYGLAPLLALFLLRGVATSIHGLHYLLAWTPFGWAELVNPVLGSNAWWLLPFVLFGAGFTALGVFFAKRDIGSSIIRQSELVRSHYMFLRSPWQLALRQNFGVFLGWTFGALGMVSLIAALTTTAIKATADSGKLSDSVHKLAGNQASLKVAFLGAGLVFLAMVLLIFAINVVGEIRRDEAKQYLDSILVGPIRRSRWLTSRILLGFAVIIAVALAAGLVLYGIASTQHISLNIGKVLATSLCATGSVGFMLGLGVCIYGLRPRLATIFMYLVVGWSFLINLLASAVQLNSVLSHSSLFYYLSFNLARWPNWTTFGVFLLIGTIFGALGVTAFTRRDIVPE